MVLTNQEISLQEANEVLFDGEEGMKSNEDSSDLKKSDERLLQQKIVQDFTLSSVPYYKKPSVKMGSIILIGCPLIWLVWSAFSTSPQAAEKQEENPYSQENEQLLASLEEARQQLEEMNIQRSMAHQQKDIQLIEPVESAPAKKETESQQSPQPAPVRVARVTQPPRPAPRRQAVRRTPVVPVVQKEIIPEIDPMTEWLAQADRGYSRTSFNKPNSETLVASSIPIPPPPTTLIRSERHLPPLSTVEPSTAETTIAANTREIRRIPKTPLLNESRLTSIRKQQSLFNDDQLRARLNRGGEILARGNDSLLTQAFEFQKQIGENGSSTENSEVLIPQARSARRIKRKKRTESEQTHSRSNSTKVLDIGSFAKATLVEGIAWTQESFNQDRKYILYLESGFENSRGIEVLPSGTRLIAQIERVSSSGLFTMKVTHIVKSFDEPKIPVPNGTLEILAKDGSPLQAKLKRKGNSDFLSDLGSVIAPGVERALDSGSSSLLVNDGFSFSTSNNNDPLSSGLSGVAKGVGDLVRDRTRRNSNRSSSLSYFQFKGDRTVRVLVNDDFYLSN
ncbi:MAG: hypothetical protein QNJ60_00380 [Xenococcaceae cyanobacterium MO_188.B19]|nr:hypothetical protein [Xenococcaceae cyanobacterium MO_188.B19]